MAPPPSARALKIHDAACAAGESGYVDPELKLFSLTAFYLQERGFCCGRGCRHCPWPPEDQRAAGRPPRPCWPGEWAVRSRASGE